MALPGIVAVEATPMTARPRVAVVLAAGRGTRMGSAKPKVLLDVAGRTLLEWVLEIGRNCGCERTIVVVGHGAREIRDRFSDEKVEWALQAEQLGTGHALAQISALVERDSLLVVLSGDAPLFRPQTARRLIAAADSTWGAMAVARLDEPGSLGRVQVDDEGRLIRCVEAVDATSTELAVETVNAGFYALPSPSIFEYLERLRPANAQGEIYLPDALNAAVLKGEGIACLEVGDKCEAWGVNDREELERVAQALRSRRRSDLGTE